MPALPQRIGKARPIVVAMAGLAEQSEVAIGGLEQFLAAKLVGAADRVIDRAAACCAAPWANDLANEINAAIDGLQDGLAVVQPDAERRR